MPHLVKTTKSKIIPFLLFIAGFYAYSRTLAPTVLEGDAALFQYTPYVLGVTYPTGFPLYILLGKLWLTIFPFGEIAWRMNLLSAICAATALPFIYKAAHRLLTNDHNSAWPHRAALVVVLTFATLPTFWRWATESKTYALNILLLSGILYVLAVGKRNFRFPFYASFLFGLSVSVHNTMILLAPGLILFVGMHYPKYPLKSALMALGLFLLPNLSYLYIPMRAEWLIAHYGRTNAIEQGLLADFYTSGLSGLIRYFTAADFTASVGRDWGLVSGRFFPIYVANLLVDEVGWVGVALGVIGGLSMAVSRPRLFFPFFLIYAMPIPFVLAYGQGEQSAFLLPSFLIFTFFIGYAFCMAEWSPKCGNLKASFEIPLPRLPAVALNLMAISFKYFLLLTAYSSLLIFFIFPRINYGFNWLEGKWSRAIYDQWADALHHPLEDGAMVVAHWGDLTSFWYMQQAEQRRPDLRGLYPPTEKNVSDALQSGRALYIAGPLQDWATSLTDGKSKKYQLIPWGRLVRIVPAQLEPLSFLPTLPYTVEANFDRKLRLWQADFSAQAMGGSSYPVTLNWQTMAELSPETVISLRLCDEQSTIAQRDDTLISGWFPQETLLNGQYLLSYTPISIPRGTLPGRYQLQLVVYLSHQQAWPLPNGKVTLDLGEVEITSPLVTPAMIANYDFNGELKLVDYQYSARRVGQGKNFTLNLLWQIRAQSAENYTLQVEVVDAGGHVWQTVEHQPTNGRLPVSQWQSGQFIRDQVEVVLPAGTPVGQESVRLRLSWLRSNQSKLTFRHWAFPIGNSLDLAWLNVVEKEGRLFTPPIMQYSINADFEDKIRLLGYDLSQHGIKIDRQLKQTDCLTGCQLHFDFYWQSLSEMAQSYTVFLHLVDKTGSIVAQVDKVPGLRGKQPTTGWLTGEVIADPIELLLPANLPVGEYSLRVGIYHPPNGARLHVSEAQPDFMEAGMIKITN